MSFVGSNILAGASGQGGAGYKIERSLRFNSADTAYLNRTPSSAGNRKTWTWSGWVKKNASEVRQMIFGNLNAGGTTGFDCEFQSDDTLDIYDYASGYGARRKTTQVFRDCSAWYHIVITYDSTNTTAADRLRLYVNGDRITEFSSSTDPTLDADGQFNTAVQTSIGRSGAYAQLNLNSNLADVHFIDGQALAASDFGEYDDNNVWQPKAFNGSYGTDGYTVSGGPYYTSSTTWAHALNGSTTGRVMTYTTTSTTATFSPGISWSSQVRIYGLVYGGGYCKVNNGSNLTGFGTGAGWVDVTSQVGSSGTLTSLTVGDVSSNYFALYAIELDGTILNVSPAGVNGFHLDFSDNSSNAALGTDSSGNNNTWTVNNISAIDSVGSIYAEYSGSSNQYLRNNSGNVMPGSNGAFTIECHFYPHTTNVIGLFDGGSGSTGIIRNYGNNTIEDQGGGSVSFAGDYTQNAWNHIAVVYTGSTSTDTMTVYVNGVSSGSASGLNGFSPGSTFDIGTINGGGDGRFDGYIRNFRVTHSVVYSSAFTAPSHTVNLTALTDTKLLVITTPALGLTGAGPGTNLGMSNNGSVSTGTLTAASETDSFIDTPTDYESDSGNNGGNYATLNPLHDKAYNSSSLTDGNLKLSATAHNGFIDAQSTIAASLFDCYCECEIKAGGGAALQGIGVGDRIAQIATGAGSYVNYRQGGAIIKYPGNTTLATVASYTTGDIIGMTATSTQVAFYKNGVLQGTYDHSLTGEFFVCGMSYHNGNTSHMNFNFGQRPFAYTPPTGFKSLCTTNIPDPTIADGSTAFDAFLYTGDGASSRNITLPLSADFLWLKKRSGTNSHQLVDTVRGDNSVLHTNSTNEAKNPQTQFTGGGISSLSGTTATLSSGTSNNNNVNENNATMVGWAWDAGTIGTNEVGDYWTPTQQTKYIGFKFPTSSGGRAVFGLTSGTGTADIFTSSDNNSWTRVQSNVTLSTTDTTYDSSSQYLLVVNTSNAVWGAFHYAMATNGTDAHYSTQTYPGSGASFTWSGPAYSDWDFRSSGTVIKPGSLNSSAYDQSRTWSNDVSGTEYSASYGKANGFDNNLSTRAGGGLTFTPPSAIACTKVRIYMTTYAAPANTIYLNGVDISSQIPVTNQYAVPLEFTPSNNQFVSYQCGNAGNEPGWFAKIELKINGNWVALIDSGVTVDSVPSIASTVRANPSAGFSIVTYTGNNSNSTVGHGLNATPGLVIVKSRSGTSLTGWMVKHSSLASNYNAALNKTDAAWNPAQNGYIGNLDSSTTISLVKGNSDGNNVNQNNVSFVAYCFSPVEGYSAFGSYTGNGSADGPFVYTGFTPKWIMFKNVSSAGDEWMIYDSERDQYNAINKSLEGNTSDGENTSGFDIDILSSGFKVRNNNARINGSGNQNIYAAFAEHPFKSARAR